MQLPRVHSLPITPKLQVSWRVEVRLHSAVAEWYVFLPGGGVESVSVMCRTTQRGCWPRAIAARLFFPIIDLRAFAAGAQKFTLWFSPGYQGLPGSFFSTDGLCSAVIAHRRGLLPICRWVRGEGAMPEALLRKGADVGEIRRADGLAQSEQVLERYNPMNAIGPKNAEPAFVIAAEVNQAATALAGTG